MMAYPFDPNKSKRFLARIILGVMAGQTAEEFAEQELTILDAERTTIEAEDDLHADGRTG
jgi:hypothetical protein